MERILRTPLFYNGNIIDYNSITIVFSSSINISVASNFFYPDYCVVYRGGGTVNTDGMETFTGILYGICGYDNNPTGNTALVGGFWQSSPTIIIPDTEILFKLGDKVVVSLANGRTIEGVVKQFETQLEPGLEGTTLWLKNGDDE